MEASLYDNKSDMTTEMADYGDIDFQWDAIQAMDRYVLPTVFSLTFLFGVAGNSLVLFVIFCMRKGALRRVTNLYLVNLAIADLLVLFLCVPFMGLIYTFESWPFGRVICKLSNYVMMTSMATSILTMTAMSIDRYCAVVGSIGSKPHRTVRSTLAVLSATWALNLLLMSPTLLITDVLEIKDLQTSYSACSELYSSLGLRRAYTLSIFSLYYVLPLAVIAISYTVMASKLWGSISPGLPASCNRRAIRRHRHVCIMVAIMVACFALCWLPIHVVHLYTEFTSSLGHSVALYVFKVVAHTLSYMNSALNPIIYSFMSHVFRQCCKSSLALCYGCKPDHGTDATSRPTPAANRSAAAVVAVATRNRFIERRQRLDRMQTREPCVDAKSQVPLKVNGESSELNKGDTTQRHTSTCI